MSKKKLFGTQIDPACEYCEKGRKTKDGQMVLCERYGVVAPYFSCRKFEYAPLKRIPRGVKSLPVYRKEEFEL